jgi:hypothetical protein
MPRHQRSNRHPLDFGLDRYQFVSVLRGAAALTVWPPNADRVIALDQLSAALLHSGQHGGAQVRVGDWRRWFASGGSRSLRDVVPDGICDSPSCVQACVLGHRYELLAGFLDAPDLMISIWTGALAQVISDTGDAIVGDALEVLLAAVAISHRISKAGDLGTYGWPDHDPARAIRVPTAREYARLIRALAFSPRDRRAFGRAADALLLDDDPVAPWRPLLPWRGGFIVARPARLLLSALVQASEAVSRSPVGQQVLATITASALKVVENAARDMDWQVEERERTRVHLRVDRDCRALVDVCVLAPKAGDLGEVDEARPALGPVFRSQTKVLRRHEHQLACVCVVGNGRAWAYEQPEGDGSAAVPIVMRLGDFRLLGDAFRREPLGLIRALEQIPRPPWPPGHSAIDMIGIARAFDELEPPAGAWNLDGIEYLHLRARVMALRHPAPAPDGSGWIDVTRWGGSPDDSMFAKEDEPADGALLVRTPGSFIWVVPADPDVGRCHIGWAVARMVAFWFARLREAGWSMIFDGEYAICATVEFDREMRGPLDVATQPGGVLVRFSRSFVEMVSRGDNSADRLLVARILEWWGALRPAGAARLLDAVVPEGRGTFIVWPDPSVDENEPRLEPPELVGEKELRDIERWVAAIVLRDYRDAIVLEEHAAAFLRELIQGIVQIVDGLLEPLGEDGVVDLVRVHERAAYQAKAEAILLPARAGIEGADQFFGEAEAIGQRGPALRGLVERIAARRPTGTERLSLRTELRLRAAYQLLVRWGAALEALWTGLARCQIAVSQTYGIHVALDGPIRTGNETAASQLTAAAPDLMAAHHSDWWTDDPVPPPELDLTSRVELDHPLWAAVNDAMRDEWGFSYEQSVRLMRAASDLADTEPTAVAVVTQRDLTAHLARAAAIDPAAVASFIHHVTLTQTPAYDPLAKGHRPWETNRERSYLQRPFVDLGDERVAFSRHHLLTSTEFTTRLIDTGRLRCKGRLFAAIRQLSRAIDREFELEVERRCQALGFRTSSRAKKLGGRKIENVSGQPLGDIDVLAWSPAQRRVVLIDAKRMAPGLPPFAMRRHRDALRQAAVRHRERLNWVRNHRDALSRHTDGEVRDDWSIDAALVLEQALPGAAMDTLAVEAWSLWDLATKLVDAGVASARG